MEQNSKNELGTASIGKLLVKMAAPAITAQIVNLLYNLVDRMYIGHIKDIGALALTGVGVTLPLIMIISAFAALISMGGAPRASIFMGKGENDNAEKILGNCMVSLVLISLVLTGGFYFFADDLLMIFGASANTIGYALEYFNIYNMGTICVQLTLGMNAFITAQGFAKTSMITVVIGAVCNIILDPILIFGFNMGVRGAALATIISQGVSAVYVIKFLMGKKTILRLKKKNLRLSPKIMMPCIALGLSPFIMQSTESIITICFNSSLLKYGGDIAVGAMTILTSIMQFTMLPLMGLSQGAQPIISYNYGARNAKRVKTAFKDLLLVSFAFSATLWAGVELFPQMFIQLFNNDPQLVEFATHALRVYMAVSGIFGIQIACQQTFIAIGNAKSSLFLAILRKILLLIPLIYILPMFMADKTTAVFMAEPFADFIAVISTAGLFFYQFKRAMLDLESLPKMS
ncbi:MAG: MATE family efflux transporter [Oscillospiraceae bacterium]